MEEFDPEAEQELALCGVCELDRGDRGGAPSSSSRLHRAALRLRSELDALLAPVSELGVTSSVLLHSI